MSDVQGTTRDTIEDTLVIQGVLFRFMDTAGIRETQNIIENIGIGRTLQAARKAQIVIDVIDPTQPVDMLQDMPELGEKTIIRVLNKADLIHHTDDIPIPVQLTISAKSGEVETLKQTLVREAGKLINANNAVTISNARHYEALARALKAIQSVQHGLQQQLSNELLSLDLQDCLRALGEITGQITSQEVLNNIFAKFCIGK